MNLKKRFSFIFSSIFSLLLAIVMLTVYFLFANFRKDEFADRLAEKAQTSAKLYAEVKEIDYNMQKTIDRNSINKLYKENTEIYDSNKKLIYDSNDSVLIKWQRSDFDRIDNDHYFFRKNGRYDVVGLFYTFEKKNYYLFISAEDTYGNSKLNYLMYLLLGAFLSGTTMVWLLSFSLSKKSLEPLDKFRLQIQNISDNNLNVRLSTAKREDEINALANSFNQMMDRIDNAYSRQREFTGNASHELRTPVARMTAQLENLLQQTDADPAIKQNLKSISEDAFQLSEIISSLIALADINNREFTLSFEKVRLDEIIFAATAELSALYTDFKLKFEIENDTIKDTDLEISGDDTLLKIVFLNLLKNAYNYSDNRLVDCAIVQHDTHLEVAITNTGEIPVVDDPAKLFTTFYRGSNTKHIAGSGIGLSIVRRVLQYHQASVTYRIADDNTNRVIITMPYNAVSPSNGRL